MQTINPNTKNAFLSALLPYDVSLKKRAETPKSINEYNLLLLITEQAITALKSQQLEKFDALAGDNMCQIRALFMAMHATVLVEQVSDLQQRVESAKNRLLNIPMTHLSYPFETLMLQEKLQIELTEQENFMIQSYLLTLTKASKEPKAETPLLFNDVTNHKALGGILKVSDSFAHNLVKETRKKLCALSVKFIRHLAESLPKEISDGVVKGLELVWRT